MKDSNSIIEDVKDYYGKQLKNSSDLKTNACCTLPNYPVYVTNILKEIHTEVLDKYYGCGLVMPEQVAGCSILDLGSGTGRDCYMLSKMVGEKGNVVGVDMTEEQLEVANRYVSYQTEKFGFTRPNVKFLKGNIENLSALGLQKNSFDIVISNCVVNLSTDKKAVLAGIFDLLKEGGEFYFSDVYADRRIPEELVADPVLYGECLSGALYLNDFKNLSAEVGFRDIRTVEARELEITNPQVKEKTGEIKFYSVTYRLFKHKMIEHQCEDYGQYVTYKGTIDHCPDEFNLDQDHTFIKNKKYHVCGNTFAMLKDGRFANHFDCEGNFDAHLGVFKTCGTEDFKVTKTSCC